jgi:hypothetical protein
MANVLLLLLLRGAHLKSFRGQPETRCAGRITSRKYGSIGRLPRQQHALPPRDNAPPLVLNNAFAVVPSAPPSPSLPQQIKLSEFFATV